MTLGYVWHILKERKRRHGQVVRQKPAKLLSPVQIRVSPFLMQKLNKIYGWSVLFYPNPSPAVSLGWERVEFQNESIEF